MIRYIKLYDVVIISNIYRSLILKDIVNSDRWIIPCMYYYFNSKVDGKLDDLDKTLEIIFTI